jgi:ABC-type glutathione transport system ATPase component
MSSVAGAGESNQPEVNGHQPEANGLAGRVGRVGRDGVTVLEVEGVSVDYKTPGRPLVHAVKDASLSLHRGEIFGVVGESGSGKSTLGRVLAGFTRPTAGTVRLIGRDGELHTVNIRPYQGIRDVQMIFQESALALDPRLAVWRSVAEAQPPRTSRTGRSARKAWAVERLSQVGLGAATAGRRPSGLSGGEKQRVAIARAMAAQPAIVICDEAVSALDVTVRAAILQLLRDIVAESGISLFFIAHDISVVSTIADTTAVMFEGSIVELGPTRDVIDHPQHAYTQRLIDAVPPLQRGPVLASGPDPDAH